MSAERVNNSLLKTISVYEALLAGVSEETFAQSPSDGSWSYSETYSHIFQSGLLSLLAIDNCIQQNGELSRKPIHWIPWLILFFGRFPPGKIKAPKRIASMVKKISREEAKALILKFKLRLGEISRQVNAADPHQKIKHPRLGLLNAKQWFRFIEVHTIHHTRQLKRIEKQLGKV
ncbi:DinB superfamily protein [Daejeonella rubra]|uniref:DinB superfamily protein n=1 Tax=Daejeonella rubra TaxID=990371 RepID=A0A1G9YG43_9SPHI|nr:DinB family protein [Daejeonella rubra]SDN07471.1 DinB superfamily protein [Daejeonella rubra]